MISTSALTTFFIALFTILSLVASAPTPAPRDVFSPPVLYPGKGTVWKMGHTYNVTWDLSNAPVNITNSNGMVVLVKNHRMIDLEHPLAAGFDIRVARHPITVPKNLKPGNDYQILVFGDSGNTGELFTITE
ncbi:hypothetical protein B0H16DRAFT_1876839 [Mycena metata]|uniref:Yeast cell wall synthesis Kre9/Knh1-like N-terminal domain-containing protein n=1 Tax=Mycena metata TaxID=1033252 RepID=A0AAD7KFD1_9AGAR|nr:hypothetical protein B0H16DRAFT_1876839 [Mycena metata]